MGIILAILKILGIILLVIVCAFLVLTALILLVPVRYRLECFFDRQEEEGSVRPCGHARITWLFHLVCFTLSYEKKMEVSLRILGIRLFPRGKEGRGKEAAEEGDLPEQDKGPSMESAEREKADTEEGGPSKEDGEDAGEQAPEIQDGIRDGSGKSLERDLTEEGLDGVREEGTGEDASLWERICRMVHVLISWLEKLYHDTEDAINGLVEKTERMKVRLEYHRGLLGGEDARILYRKGMGALRGLLGHVKPQKIKAGLEVGTGDPASTGQIMAIGGMLYPLLGENVRIVPDFERKCLVGDIHVKGRIRACAVLFHVLRIALDRRLWRLIKQLKKGGTD